MRAAVPTETRFDDGKSWLDRALSVFTDVRAGEGGTALLMLLTVFLLLICYSVIKTAREPLILLGGGAEVRSYTAAGQALMLMGFVPMYSWFASRVDRIRLLVGVSLFFTVNIELFALAVAARVPYVGVAFFIWVGIFNMSLVAQFWAYANDIYSKEAGDRLFPMIVIGQTAGGRPPRRVLCRSPVPLRLHAASHSSDFGRPARSRSPVVPGDQRSRHTAGARPHRGARRGRGLRIGDEERLSAADRRDDDPA